MTASLYARTLSALGASYNNEKTIEECAELISEIQRVKQGRGSVVNLALEAADAWICLEILRLQLGNVFDHALDERLNRLAVRVEIAEGAK